MDVYSRHVKHLTQNTPNEPVAISIPCSPTMASSSSIPRSDPGGKDSSIFVFDLASGKATDLTPHQGEQTFEASDISPDGKTVLITSNAHNGYDNVGLLDIATQKITWLTNDKWEMQRGRVLARWQHRRLDGQRRRQHQPLSATT